MKSNFENLFGLKGKVALVTGGAGLLGSHFCRGLAEMGANVAVIDIQAAPAEKLARELEKEFGVKALGLACNVASPEAVKETTAAVVKALGGIDILLNNAASRSEDLDAFFAPFEKYTLEEWRKIMSVNLDGAFLVAQAVGDQMVKQGRGGAIVQTSSIYGLLAPDNSIYEGSFYLGRKISTPPVYAASKAGIVGLTKYLSTYWAGQGIRVNCLVPGGVESGQNDEFRRRYGNRIPLGRMAQPHEMVAPMLYLVSEASSYVTGQSIFVDGGLSAW